MDGKFNCDHCDRLTYDEYGTTACGMNLGGKTYYFRLCKDCRKKFLEMALDFLINRNDKE